MAGASDLERHLSTWAAASQPRRDVADVVLAMAQAARDISDLLSRGALAGPLGASTGRCAAADEQRSLDLIANGRLLDAARSAPVAGFLSKETAVPIAINGRASLLLAVDPIDAALGFETGAPVGTTFAILPSPAAAAGDDLSTQFLQAGSRQLAGGAFLYGPFTALALTVGDGTHIFTLDRVQGRFVTTDASIQIPAVTQQFAINTANARHWGAAVRAYVDDCQRGRDGPRARDFGMRWTGSPVADIWRILVRGGIYIDPGDPRDGGHGGRLRSIYQANPLAFLVEQAGGVAAAATARRLDLVPGNIHQRTPLIAGSRDEVDYVIRLHLEPDAPGERSQLFGHRGLFWA